MIEFAIKTNFELPVELFQLIRDFIHEKSGIYFDDTKKFMLESKLAKRVRLLQLNNFMSKTLA